MTPYAPPENHDAPSQQTSTIAKVIAVIDSLLGAAVAFMTIDYPIVSPVVLVVTWTVAFGLFQTHAWGWWTGMALHCLILAGGTIGYVVIMINLVAEFGRPPNHMALITPRGAANILTIVYAVAVILAAIPVLALWSRGCRTTFGLLKAESAAPANN